MDTPQTELRQPRNSLVDQLSHEWKLTEAIITAATTMAEISGSTFSQIALAKKALRQAIEDWYAANPVPKASHFDIQCGCGHQLRGTVPDKVYFLIECMRCGQWYTHVVVVVEGDRQNESSVAETSS